LDTLRIREHRFVNIPLSPASLLIFSALKMATWGRHFRAVLRSSHSKSVLQTSNHSSILTLNGLPGHFSQAMSAQEAPITRLCESQVFESQSM
jgi:hypothetical protein